MSSIYPGYAGIQSATSERIIFTAAISAYRKITTMNKNAVVHVSGYSLGTASASYLAANCSVKSLVLAAPFTSFPEVGRTILPALGSLVDMALVGHEYKSISWAPMITAPTLIVHGKEDTTVPFVQGETLSKSIKSSNFKEVPEVGHNSLTGRDNVIEFSKDFYRKL